MDLISRQAAINELRDAIVKDVQFGDELTDGYNDGIDMAITVISILPPAQPEIIHCKDCRHNGSFDTDCPIGWNGKEYCSFAERREE